MNKDHVFTDITERKQAEVELRRLNRELRAISDCNQLLIRAEDEKTLLDDICTAIFLKAGYCMAWVGYAEQDNAKTVRPVAWAGAENGYLSSVQISWADTELGRGPTGTAIRNGATVHIQDFMTDARIAPWRDNALRHGYKSSIALPLRDKRGIAFGAITVYSSETNAFTPDEKRLLEGFANDLAFGINVLRSRGEQKRAEEALRESERNYRFLYQQFRSLLDANPDVLMLLTPDMTIQWANKSVSEVAGLPEQGLLGRHCFHVLHKRSEPCQDCPAVRTFHTLRMESQTLKASDGVIRDLRAIPIFDESGKIINIIEMARDITEYRTLEAQYRQAQKMEAIGLLAGGVAHDFNNILNIIIGYGTMIQDEVRDNWRMSSYIDEVLIAANRAANLTKRLLAFSRKQVMEIQPVNVGNLITGLEKMLRRIVGEDIIFNVELASGEMVVMADSGQIEQVLMNIVTNARDAMPKGGKLTIRTSAREIDEQFIATYGYGKAGTYAVISITDTGIGMDMNAQRKIFDPFFTTKGVGRGTGLGLSIAYGIVEQHKGYIKVYSEVEKGTTFNVLLPLLGVEASQGEVVQDVTPIKGGTETILVVEDDADLRKLSRITLEAFGYTVIVAEDGEDAITKFSENSAIQLVILDVIMPKKSGKDAFDEIKNINPDMKALFMTGYASDIISRQDLQTGTALIYKPVSPIELIQRVREVLDA